MTSTESAAANEFAHVVELHQRITTSRAAVADAVDQLRLAVDVLPDLTTRTLDRLLVTVTRQLADAERMAAPMTVAHARLAESITRTTDDQQPMLTTGA